MNTIRWQDHIAIDPKIMLGKPVVKNTRITVELVVDRLSYGETIEQLLEAYPHLTREDVLACLQYAAHLLSQEIIHETAA
ncbi:DUF433 domain-containing protein [Nibrella viscosa]|uniref:DUF433 domain-containing protein n=1 Tax=Nibrella viscosa TaxID=1084524 RepID=A0ABP8KSA6_9BACT